MKKEVIEFIDKQIREYRKEREKIKASAFGVTILDNYSITIREELHINQGKIEALEELREKARTELCI